MGVLKYLNSLTGMPANLNLRKLTASHFNALITQKWTILTHLVIGSLHGPMTLMRDLSLTLVLMNLLNTPKGQSKLSVTPCPTIMANQYVLRTNQHAINNEIPDYKKSRPFLVGSMWILSRKPWNSLPNGESPYPIHPL